MIQIYAKIDNYQITDNFDIVSPEDFAKKSEALKLLYPTATIHFVEVSRKKWPFIVGAVADTKSQKQKLPKPSGVK